MHKTVSFANESPEALAYQMVKGQALYTVTVRATARVANTNEVAIIYFMAKAGGHPESVEQQLHFISFNAPLDRSSLHRGFDYSAQHPWSASKSWNNVEGRQRRRHLLLLGSQILCLHLRLIRFRHLTFSSRIR